MVEFDGIRARLYEQALTEYPLARKHDHRTMRRLLAPLQGEKILGFGEGNGFFASPIANAIGNTGHYVVSDPSIDQLENLKARAKHGNIEVVCAGAESLDVENSSVDKVWSFGAFHHCQDKAKAMGNVYRALKKGGRAVICDVFKGSRLAKHFDIQVARYCVTGHKVTFLSNKEALRICKQAGFDPKKVEIKRINQKWVFDSEIDVGKFIHDLHAMVLLFGTEEERYAATLEGCKKYLGVKRRKDGKIALNWPMKALILTK